MRHRKNVKRLGRQSAHRKAVLRNQAKSLLVKEKIITTLALAKESRRTVEKLITLGKKGTLAARRLAFEALSDHTLVKLLFSEIAPRFMKRAGGYTRVIHAGRRRGDNAELAVLELTEQKEKINKEKKEKKTAKESLSQEAKDQTGDKKEKHDKKEKQKEKEVKSEPAVETGEKEHKNIEESGKDGEKGFMGGLRKFFKKNKQE